MQVVGEPRRTTQTLGTVKALIAGFPSAGWLGKDFFCRETGSVLGAPKSCQQNGFMRLPFSGGRRGAGQSTAFGFGGALKRAALVTLTMGLAHVT